MVVVGMSVVHVMVWCGQMCCVERVACGPWLCWGVMVERLVEPALIFCLCEARARPGGGVMVLIVMPLSPAFWERRSMCDMDGPVLVQGRAAALRCLRFRSGPWKWGSAVLLGPSPGWSNAPCWRAGRRAP